jgi:hypothetical protein
MALVGWFKVSACFHSTRQSRWVLTAQTGQGSLYSGGAVEVAVVAAESAVLRLVVGQERLAEKELFWTASCPLHPSRSLRLSLLVCLHLDLSLHLSTSFPIRSRVSATLRVRRSWDLFSWEPHLHVKRSQPREVSSSRYPAPYHKHSRS